MSAFEIKKYKTLTGHDAPVYALSTGLRPGTFYSSGNDGMIVEWRPEEGEDGRMLAKVSNSVYALALIPETGRLIAGHNYDGIHIIDLDEGRETGSLKLTDAAIFDIKYHKQHLFVATGSGEIVVIDTRSMKVIERIKLSGKRVRTLEISGDTLFAGYSDNTIRAIGMKDLKERKAWIAHENSVFTLKKDPAEQFLFSGGRDARLKAWNLNDDFAASGTIVAHMFTINTIDFNPEGTHFVTGSMDKTIKLWDKGEGRLLKVIDKARFGGHLSSVNKLVWSNYKNRVISCSDDRTISLWDIKILKS